MSIDVLAPVSSRDRGARELADALPAIRAELANLRARVSGVEARQDAIEARLSTPLRRADREALSRILPAIAGALGSDMFLASEAIASENAALVLVLAGINGRRLGRLLRRGEGIPIDGYIVHGQGMEADAVLWEVLRVP